MALFRPILCALVLVLAVWSPAPVARAAAPPPRLGPSPYSLEPRFFPETGHYISGRFRQYWEENGGLAAFGYPLTRPFEALLAGNQTRLVQYFERARFEYEQSYAQPHDVLLTRLGADVTGTRRDEPAFRSAAPLGEPGTTFAAPTAHNLGGLFRRHWEAEGGLTRFGYPLSEEFREVSASDGLTYMVQYFERARFELHPEQLGTADEVQFGQLGRERLERDAPAAGLVAPESALPGAAERPGYFLPRFPLIAGQGELGANAFLVGTQDTAATAYNARATGALGGAGMGWVRLQLVWGDLEPARGDYRWLPLDTRIEAAHAAGIKVLLSVVKPPAWASPPGRPGAFSGDTTPLYYTLAEVVSRYRGRVQAIEIGNEPNLASEVGGEVDVAAYFNTLKAGYLAIKRTDPDVIVVLGGLLATGLDDPRVAVGAPAFLRRLYAADDGAARFFDAVGFHPAGTANPPEARFPDAPGSGACPAGTAAIGPCYRDAPDFYFRQAEELRTIMEERGDGAKQVWLTEFGWDSCQGLPAPTNYEYCQLVSEQQQADYTIRAITYAREHWAWVGPLILWNLNYATIPGIAPGDEMVGWSAFRADWSPRPLYDALVALPR